MFLDLGTRRGWGVSVTPQPLSTPGKDPVPIVQEAGWAAVPVWTGGKSRPTGIRSPDRPARGQSLYGLSYPAHESNVSPIKYKNATERTPPLYTRLLSWTTSETSLGKRVASSNPTPNPILVILWNSNPKRISNGCVDSRQMKRL